MTVTALSSTALASPDLQKPMDCIVTEVGNGNYLFTDRDGATEVGDYAVSTTAFFPEYPNAVNLNGLVNGALVNFYSSSDERRISHFWPYSLVEEVSDLEYKTRSLNELIQIKIAEEEFDTQVKFTVLAEEEGQEDHVILNLSCVDAQ